MSDNRNYSVIQLLPSHARLFRHHAFRGTQSKRGRGGIVMWFKRRRNEFGCPMCGRLPKIVKSHTQDGDYIKSIYRLQYPRKHLSTNWYSDPMDASIQWKHVVDEYKRKDTK